MSEDERRELEETGELRLLDPATNTRYVAVKEEFLREIQELDYVRKTYPAIPRVWDMEPDPTRGAYDDLRPR